MLKGLHLLLCLCGLSLFFWGDGVRGSRVATDAAARVFSAWPSEFEGRALVPVPQSDVELAFAAGFPGRIGYFQQGKTRIVLHWIARPTRAFHFSGACLQGRGWTVKPRPRLIIDGEVWGVRTAERGGERARLRQRISDAEGRVWFDESAWYWATLRGETQGPWTAWTVVEPRATE